MKVEWLHGGKWVLAKTSNGLAEWMSEDKSIA